MAATASSSRRLAPNSLSVVRPSIASKKCALIRASRRHWRWLSAWVPLPISTMKNGTNGAVINRINPETQSFGKITTSSTIGSAAASIICGR